LLVKFAPYVSDILDRAGITRSGGPATRSGILSVDEILDIVGGYEIERVFPVDPRNEERTRESELHLWYVVRFGEEFTAAEVAEKLSALGEEQHVQLQPHHPPRLQRREKGDAPLPQDARSHPAPARDSLCER